MTLTPEQEAALRALRRVFPTETIVVIGATALALQLRALSRRTNDIDLTVTVAHATLVHRLRSSDFDADPRIEHRFRRDGLTLDILAVESADLRSGSRRMDDGDREMNLIGFDLALTEHVAIDLGEGLQIGAATIPVVILLKMGAYLDRPSERERDLEDLADVLNHYLESDDDRRFSPPLSGFDYELQSTVALASDLEKIAQQEHRALVRQFLDLVSAPSWHRARLRRALGRSDDALSEVLAAFSGVFEP